MSLRPGGCVGADARIRAGACLGRRGFIACGRRGLLGARLRFAPACRIRSAIDRAPVALAKLLEHVGRLLCAREADQPAQARDRCATLPDQLHQAEQSLHEPPEQLVVRWGQQALRPLDQSLDRRHLDLDDLRLVTHGQPMAHRRGRKSFTSG